MKSLLFSMFFLFSAVASAASASVQPPDFKTVLTKQTFTLDRPLVTFHYRSWDYDPKSQAEAWRLVRDAASNFWRADLDKDQNMIGPGFYTSVDSAATRGYGNQAPQLYAVTLKKGARLLDARGITDVKASKEFSTAAAKFECFKDGKDTWVNIGALRNSPSKACQAETLKVLKELKIDAILYTYSGSGSLANCDSSRDLALNIISTENIEEGGVGFYSDKSKLEKDPKDSTFVLQLFNEGRKDDSLTDIFSSIPQLPPASLSNGPSLDNKEYESMKAQLIWKCGPKRTAQDNDSERIAGNYKRALVKDGYQRVANELAKAYLARFTNGSYGNWVQVEPRKLRGLLYMQYQASGMAKDSSKWDRWLQATVLTSNALYYGDEKGQEKTLKQIADLFEEEVRIPSEDEKKALNEKLTYEFMTAKKEPYIAYPGFYYELMKGSGGGPRLTAARTNSGMPVPFVIGPVPTNPNKNYTAYSNKNREFVIHFMRKCIEQYNDTRLSSTQIRNGECGVISTLTESVGGLPPVFRMVEFPK